MKIKNKIIILLAATLAVLASCKDDYIAPVYTVGETEKAIILRAGVNEEGTGIVTRAVPGDDNHAKHVAFTSGTKVALRMDGLWTGHSPSADIKQKTIATLGAVSDKHNPLSTYNPVVYWDDYGMADPANASSGREQGLTIYGAAVNGKTTELPATLSSLDNTQSTWKTLPWSVGTPVGGVINQTGGWDDYDLLTSNNVTPANDNAFKFVNRKDGKLLEFTHAMTKITVELTAGEGFPRTTAADPLTAHFETEPTVTLSGFNYTGKVDVEAKTSTPTGSTSNIKMRLLRLSEGGTTHKATFDALVFPGNVFANDNTRILTLTADGNTLYVTAAKLNEAIQNAIDNNAKYPGTDKTLLQAWNYKLLITVDKTDLKIEATIVEWNQVEAAEEAPKINIDYAYGHVPGSVLEDGFTLYRSTAIGGSYIGTGDKADVTYVPAAGEPIVPAHYTMAPQLYWPTQSTHYFFRGVWPTVGSIDGSSAQLGPTSDQVKANAVDVENAAYKQGYYPSDLMIGRPLNTEETATDELCKVDAHKDGSGNNPAGICATTGDIRMNFRYMMSQVKVELTSSASTDPDYIAFDANTKVEIIGGYKDGAIKLSDCTVDYSGKTVADYQLHNKAADDYDSYHDAIIPQDLTEGMKFRITTQNEDGTTDTYEAVIKNIKVSEGSNPAALISAWMSGKAYTYTLKITKTAINVTATITDWIPVTASDNVWF